MLGTSPNPQASHLIAEVSRQSGETCTAHCHAVGVRPRAGATAVPGRLEGGSTWPQRDGLLSWPPVGGMETRQHWLPFVHRTKNKSRRLPSLTRTRPREAARKGNAALQSGTGRQRQAACHPVRLLGHARSPATRPEMGSTSKWHLAGAPRKLQAWGRWEPLCHHRQICSHASITAVRCCSASRQGERDAQLQNLRYQERQNCGCSSGLSLEYGDAPGAQGCLAASN